MRERSLPLGLVAWPWRFVASESFPFINIDDLEWSCNTDYSRPLREILFHNSPIYDECKTQSADFGNDVFTGLASRFQRFPCGHRPVWRIVGIITMSIEFGIHHILKSWGVHLKKINGLGGELCEIGVIRWLITLHLKQNQCGKKIKLPFYYLSLPQPAWEFPCSPSHVGNISMTLAGHLS